MSLKIWVTTPFFYPDMSRPWSEVFNDMLSIVDAAEDLGFEGVTVNENHFQNYVTNPSSIMFSALAAQRTKRLRIMPGIVVLPYYNPLIIASEMSFLDQMAPGRIGIGVARGGSSYQLERVGVDMANARAMYEESLEIIRKVWTEDDVSYDGKFYNFPETTIVPKPASDPHPEIWAASQSVDGVKRVAEQGLNLITAPNHGNFEPYGDLETLLAAYDDAVAVSEHPRQQVMVLRHTWLGETEEKALEYFDDFLNEYNHYRALVKGSGSTASKEGRLAARTGGAVDDGAIKAGLVRPESESFPREGLYEKYSDPILTTPERMIERFKTYEKLGVDHMACLVAVGQPTSEVIKNMEFMAKEVLPEFC
ncbi:LLM class flavin-dependent oxidoreductase [Gordonia sp. zg691]|uniref:LLM class flavin-dependent oxidoreductase n=1 Tax=Gordonia jinghuaiqii TaxID=2758710 RepID=A0A7D7R1X2_9ACTN|nr:LLM class flavin-dependent oxidoreductase [Gordonia jinghuaiqii]MBD0863651.1 LLM class flavin-dependent oxidoreductase [Gordonia jinghuaiqii]MCR5979385.1 LLM class flavin-dependent oxidoreductase [Gordonia jinghuaiqii]QMT01167.1 LLM class flavin-dependent oxidoreductase [Gordonia jinghuaiqii]